MAIAKRVSYRAIKCIQNRRTFYFATIPVDHLFPSCFVARRDENPEKGFQRALSEPRADDIAKYLADGKGSIPSNIVLSAQDGADLRFDARAGSISFRGAPSIFLVLDGQHRLWGYSKCTVRHRVPVAVYSGLSGAEEARLFIDINTTQRGVPAALLLDIKQMAELEGEQESLLRNMFDRLQSDPASPMVGKLSPSKSLAGKISRVTFNRSLKRPLSGGVLVDAPPEARYRLVLNYLKAFDAELPVKSMLCRSAYFEAVFELFDEVVRNSMASQGNARQESLQRVVGPLARLSFQGGLPTKQVLMSTLQTALRKTMSLTEDMLY